MSDELPGPHHCIGTARAVTELVFRGLRAECAASGGTMSLVEIENFYSRIIDSFSSGFDLFELRHSRCMDASLSRAAMPFARSTLAVFSAATPSPMWLMFRLAAKFLYASMRRFKGRIPRFPLPAPRVTCPAAITLRPRFGNCLADFKIRFSRAL